MKYIPVNIKTGIRYPAISEEEKKKWEADPSINGGARKRYRFEAVPEPKGAPAPAPVEAKLKEEK